MYIYIYMYMSMIIRERESERAAGSSARNDCTCLAGYIGDNGAA